MNLEKLDAKPVIIVGAGRSGTNILRDVLTEFGNVFTWPCDEINYIWRHGNRSFSTDEFPKDLATDSVKSYIRGQFKSLIDKKTNNSNRDDKRYIIEKTCANSLRIDFVNEVIPEAYYIFIVRDGRDVVASARQRWKAKLNISYILAKARYVPASDFIFYAYRYFINRLSKIVNKNNSLSAWGPKFAGMDAVGESTTLEELCEMQWVRCIRSAELSFKSIDPTRIHRVSYEDFVTEPFDTVKSITNFLGIKCNETDIITACTRVNTESLGKGAENISASSKVLSNEMRSTLEHLGYM